MQDVPARSLSVYVLKLSARVKSNRNGQAATLSAEQLDALADAAVPPVQGDGDASGRKVRAAEARARSTATRKAFLKRKAR